MFNLFTSFWCCCWNNDFTFLNSIFRIISRKSFSNAFDGAEVCELVVLYLLNILKSEFGGKNIGLYRDDGLGSFENKSDPELEKTKKKISKIFKDNGLNITIETNLHITEYLEVTFNLKTWKYYPYRKQNNSLQYIHNQSNPCAINNQANSIYDKQTVVWYILR